MKKRKKNWKEKVLHGKFTIQTVEIGTDEPWRWLRNGFLKEETEGMILAAQKQALRINSINSSTDKTSDTPLCGDNTETIRYN